MKLMHDCPSCRTRLIKHRVHQKGVYWACRKCDGRAVGFGLFKKYVDREAIASLWRQVALNREGRRQCPFCQKKMRLAFAPRLPKGVELEACNNCYHLWFDAGELKSFKTDVQIQKFKEAKKANFGKFEEIPPDQINFEPSKEMEARARRLMDYKKPPEVEAWGDGFAVIDSPPEAWQWVPAFLGLPVEHRNKYFKYLPWVTWLIAFAVFAVSTNSFQWLDSQIGRFAFYPSDPFRDNGITLLTSFFLHGGWMHLLGNLYFFLVFGDDVEDFLGGWLYIMLIALATIAGNLVVAHFFPEQAIPHVGASGGIFGIIVFYMLKFPKSRISFLPFPLLWRLGVLRMPAWAALAWFLAINVMGAYTQFAGFTHVSFLSHLGGGLVGAIFWVLFGLGKE